ncbi:MAG: class B sortase [Lentisphaerae bacterium]|nr:class B sortase [Lentisphaerota bacterium]
MLLAALSLAVCLIWAVTAIIGGIQDARSGARVAELQAIQAAPAEQGAALSPVSAATPEATPEPPMLPNLAPLYDQNPDLAGWLTIEGTVIDYPVMFRPDDDDHYLTHNFDNEKDQNGSLLIQMGCDPFASGRNTIIHGHNMKSGKMFGDLEEYKKEAYWKEHPVIRFDTLYERGEYEVVAVFLSQVYRKTDDVFKYYHFFGAKSQAEFDEFYSNIKALALYDTGVTAQYGDTFITLSTCVYHVQNGRLVVVAKKVQ